MSQEIRMLPEQASTVAGQVDAIYLWLIGVSVFFSLLIAGLLLYFAIRYRRRAEGEVGGRFDSSTLLEITWSVIPLVIVLATFFWGAKIYFTMFRPPADAIEYFATGKQWMWKIQHPSGQREINEMHVPVGVPIKVTMTSEDVIHSFFIPAFRVKSDVLPGRYTTLWFKATKTGTFHLFCTEYCGSEHSLMIGKVVVMEPEAYQQWLAGGPAATSMAEAGEQLFGQLACSTCHQDGPTGRGPALAGVFGSQVRLASGRTVVADENYIRESILNPQAKVVFGYEPIMPTYQGQIGEEGLLQLLSYVKSLAPKPAETAAAPDAAGDGSAR